MLAVTVGATAWAPWWTRASSTAAPTPPCKEDLHHAGAATQGTATHRTPVDNSQDNRCTISLVN